MLGVVQGMESPFKIAIGGGALRRMSRFLEEGA